MLQYKAKAKAAEEAEEEENEEEPKPLLRTYTWRYSVPALLLGGQSLDDAEHDIKDNLLNYDGGFAVIEWLFSAVIWSWLFDALIQRGE